MTRLLWPLTLCAGVLVYAASARATMIGAPSFGQALLQLAAISMPILVIMIWMGEPR